MDLGLGAFVVVGIVVLLFGRSLMVSVPQATVVGMRAEIVQHTKKQLDEVVSSWATRSATSRSPT
jgi:hypothetical protein